jgi:hypothetical protein
MRARSDQDEAVRIGVSPAPTLELGEHRDERRLMFTIDRVEPDGECIELCLPSGLRRGDLDRGPHGLWRNDLETGVNHNRILRKAKLEPRSPRLGVRERLPWLEA